MRTVLGGLVLFAVVACGSDRDPPAEVVASTTSSAAANVSADGFPVGFAYPDGSIVKTTAPAHSLYTVPGTGLDAVRTHWEAHLTALGFEVAAESDGSGTYQRGTTTVQVTWTQAGAEIRGAAKVLTP